MLAIQDPQSWMPPAASSFTDDVDGVWALTFWLNYFFFFLIVGILAYSVFKWRRRSPTQPAASTTTHNTTLEVVWTLIPLVIMMVLFAWGWKGSMDMTIAPADCLQYQVKAKQWEWQFWHPGSDSASVDEMWVPVNTNVKLTMYSEDVLHSFFVPAFRCKRDVLPGRYQMVWFKGRPRPGRYPMFCAEYCGRNHSYMRGWVNVVTQEEYDKKPWDLHPQDPIEWGQWLWDKRCDACHTNDGAKLVGPTFKGLWGKEEPMEDGSTALVDRAYVVESLRNPSAKIVKGFADQTMTPFPDINDEEIDAICAYLESIK